jgi:RNA polymerase sigma factor for flagellar operon FliA
MIAYPCSSLDALAALYAQTRSAAVRERLCEEALPLVRRIATVVRRRLPQHFGADDLIGDGCLGLLRAVDRFDPAFGVTFESWAGRIIRGAMLNGLRRMDAVPERVRRDARALDTARWFEAQRTGRAPSDGEAASCASITPAKLAAIREAARHAPLSLDGPACGDAGGTISERLVSGQRDPGAIVAEAALRRIVSEAVTMLPGRERVIVQAFYGRGVTFGEIGQTLGVSKQRVSQLHSRAISCLRAALAGLPLDR